MPDTYSYLAALKAGNRIALILAQVVILLTFTGALDAWGVSQETVEVIAGAIFTIAAIVVEVVLRKAQGQADAEVLR